MLKKTSRIGLILLALILAFTFVFTGCKRGPQLKGAKILIAEFGAGAAYNVDTRVPEGEGAEAELEYRKKILADNNMWIEAVQISDWDGYFPLALSNIMSGSKEYSIYVMEAGWAMTLYSQGLLYPVSESSVKLDNRVPVAGKKGAYAKMMEDLFTINGKQYGFCPGIGGFSWLGNFVFFNKRLFKEAGLDPDLPFNMQKDGTWTWDNFLDICKQLTRDIDNNGVIDIYAMPSDDIREVMYGLVYANNGKFVDIDENGVYHNATNTPEFLEAMAFFARLVNEGVVKLRRPFDQWGWNWSEFMDGRVAMVFDPEWRQENGPNMTDDYGIVLAPKGPRADNYRTSLTDIVYVIPSYFTREEVDVILKGYDLWNVPMDTEWRTQYYPFHSDIRSVNETMVLQRQVAVYRDFAIVPGYPTDLLEDDPWWERSPSQVVESWAPIIQDILDWANGLDDDD
jgi:ABC-type glycerol-3-phosphate transport system substrate-binding protein